MNRRTSDHYAACLLGGALGDALGWPVEFLGMGQIRARFGEAGIQEPLLSRRGIYEITDDTQMMLFTAEGLIRAKVRMSGRGICDTSGVVRHAYRRWYRTQTSPYPGADGFTREDGWLIRHEELWSPRAPGNTCMSALADEHGRDASNDSKGCGTVMKTAPVGLVANDAFSLGADLAALTHGHPTGQIAAGFLSQLIWHLAKGAKLPAACREARARLDQHDPRHRETIEAVERALRRADAKEPIAPDDLEALGGGWVAEEAVAISLLAALRAESFEHGVRLAVNHSGDSDSTGAITGNILGLLLGRGSLPASWLKFLELRDVIETVARDLHGVNHGEVPCTAAHGITVISPGSPPDEAAASARRAREAEETRRYRRWFERYPGC
jgi:ADP-ribosylglycohydrolase